jgi:uncharacterized OsmC-like protein
MGTVDIRAIQAPLKERYRSDPSAARITLAAHGRLGQGITCSVDSAQALVQAGLHPATGGTDTTACSGDLLLEALAACAGVTLMAVATAMGTDVRDGTVHAEGELDFRGTLGVSREAPVGFAEIRLRFDLVSSAPKEQLDTLIRLTERYCVVLQTLRQSPRVTATYRADGEPAA